MIRLLGLLALMVAIGLGLYFLLRSDDGGKKTKSVPLDDMPTEPLPVRGAAPVTPRTPATPTELWSLAQAKPFNEWMGTRMNRLVRLVQRDDTLYVENVSGDDYVERKRGGILLGTVYIVDRSKRSVMVWAADLAVADTIEREVVPACESPTDTGLRGVVASDDAVRRLLADVSYAEPLPEVD